jgi:hypothetical protein
MIVPAGYGTSIVHPLTRNLYSGANLRSPDEPHAVDGRLLFSTQVEDQFFFLVFTVSDRCCDDNSYLAALSMFITTLFQSFLTWPDYLRLCADSLSHLLLDNNIVLW